MSVRSYPIVYYPFHHEELMERLRSAGFTKFRMGSASSSKAIANANTPFCLEWKKSR